MQAHMSGQVTGQVPNQADLVQQNGNTLPVQQQPNGIRSWHMEGDHTPLRTCINKKIHDFLSRRLKEQHPDWQMRLPDMVKRLEGLLFRQASTKEEYMNVANLEQRLQSIIKQVQNRNHSLSQQNAPVGTMIPTPGLQHSGSASTMIPTPGTDTSMVSGPGPSNMIHSATGMGSISMCNTENPNLVQGTLNDAIQPQHGVGNMSSSMMKGMGMPRVGSQMIPTPGLNNSQTMSTNSNGLVPPNVDSLVVSQNQQLHPQQQFQHQQQQQNLYSGNQNNRIYPSMNGQMNGMMAMGMQHKNPYLLNGGMSNGMQFMPGNQHVMNGSSALNSIGSYMNHSRYGVHSQHMNQRQRQVMQLTNQMGSMSSDGYAMNAADLAGSAAGNLYGSATTSGHAAGGNLALNSVPAQSKMIPVPGLPNQQQPVQQHKSQALEYTQQNNYQLPRNQSGQIYPSQVQQPLQQSTQHQMHQTQQYHQQHYTQHQNQQPQIKTEDTQQFHMAQTLSPQSHSSVGLHPQSETINNLDGSHPSSEQLQQQVTTMQMQQSMSAGMMQIDQVLPESQHLNHQTAQKAHHLQAFSPQEQQQSLSQNDSSSLHNEMMPDSASHALHNPEERLHGREQVRQPADGQHGQQEVEQSMSSQDISQNNQAQPRAYLANEAMQPNSIKNESSSGGTGPSGQPAAVSEARQAQYHKQQRWLLFLRHASKCIAPEGQCNMPHCPTAKQLWIHITKCQETQCMYPKCQASKTLLRHHQQCRDANCPVCSRVRQIIMQQRQGMAQRSNTGDTSSTNGLRRSVNPTVRSDSNGTTNMKFGSASPDAISIQQPPTKKPKVEPSSPSPVPVTETQVSTVGNAGKIATNQLQTQVTQQSGLCQGPVKSDTLKPGKLENLPVKAEIVASTSQYMLQRSQEIKKETVVDAATQSQKVKDDPCVVPMTNVFSQTKQDFVSSKKELGQVKMESGQVKQEPSTAEPSADNSALSKQGKPKIKGVSLTELFTPEQIKEHITGLRQWVGQSKAKAERHQAMENQMSENSCQLCAVEKLTFEPPPIYCTLCGGRIKRNSMYFTLGSGDTRHYFCIPCHNDVRGEAIEVDGISLPKSRLEKRKNDEETEEAWVQCDKCEAWQHQVCALFNGRRNEGGQAEYTCPNCYVTEVERGERKPLPQSAVLGAKDLPRTQLSDHIEQRLFKKLKQERLDRAKSQGKTYEEVQGAESLVVRVVSNVDKKLEVKQRFLDVFKEEDYPTEYPYKSKVLLLFQKIEGVEVCLFGMYVQEFGTESSQPNQRRVYLSYLDSVKYFRPEVKAVTGEALRTFVYHEILIGYLEYCKRRGLTSCYIWACPPLKGEDYILYCHPEIQKTPKSDKLREWYLTMLKKATKENIVVELTNLHDHFFVPMDESKAKVTAVRLPYFDGDYWPGAAEDFIMQLQQEEEDGRKQQKKGKTKKTATKRATKAAAQAELTSNASKDALLMQRLRDSIAPMKEDFIMVHLQYACAHCCSFILYGKRWSCQQCKSFNLCDKCYEAQQRLDEREWHPVNGREKHSFYPIEVPDVPTDTTDKDELVESEFFDTRQAFLSLCQGNHYQYDTLRRAKHSSMMVLYHLHNPTAPAFVTTCNICHHDIETGQGWRCETCPDFDICNACYRKNGSSAHPHKLTQHTSLADRDAQSKEARQQRVLQLRIMLELLVHASKCGNANCLYPNCRRVKGLFRHGMQCKIRASGGCALCKKMWYILQLHARACKESECKVPRCKDLKEHLRRLQQQMESRRRAAVNEMMRQRKAEVAGQS